LSIVRSSAAVVAHSAPNTISNTVSVSINRQRLSPH
jgi:hypothetical protein